MRNLSLVCLEGQINGCPLTRVEAILDLNMKLAAAMYRRFACAFVVVLDIIWGMEAGEICDALGRRTSM